MIKANFAFADYCVVIKTGIYLHMHMSNVIVYYNIDRTLHAL